MNALLALFPLLLGFTDFSKGKVISDPKTYHRSCMKRSVEIFGDKDMMMQKKHCICEYELGRREPFLSGAPGWSYARRECQRMDERGTLDQFLKRIQTQN